VSKMSAAGSGPTEHYMRRLADGLDALPPSARAEVLAEIRGHIADATVEAGGDEAAALVAFGNPEEMATRILTERGVIAENLGLQAAPGWMRWAAVGIDAGWWLVLLVFLLAVPFGLLAYAGTVAMVAAWVYVAAVAGGTVWWWVRKRRQRGYASAGMNIMDLRRVRVRGATKLVRATDLGEPPRSKGALAGSIVWAVVIVVVVGGVCYGGIAGAVQNSASGHEQIVQDVANDTLDVERVVDGIYNAALKGEAVSSWFAPQASGAAADLLARHAAGAFDAYSVDRIEFLGYKPMPYGDDLAGYVLTALVEVTESRGDTGQVLYQYRVVKRITDLQVSRNGASTSVSYSGQWQVEEVTRLGG
jgi:hypothetical protein